MQLVWGNDFRFQFSLMDLWSMTRLWKIVFEFIAKFVISHILMYVITCCFVFTMDITSIINGKILNLSKKKKKKKVHSCQPYKKPLKFQLQ